MFGHKPRNTILLSVLALGCMICHATTAPDYSANGANTAKPERFIPPVKLTLRANRQMFNQGEFVEFTRTSTNVSMFDVEMPVFKSGYTRFYWTRLLTLKTRTAPAGLRSEKPKTITLKPGETIVEKDRFNLVTHNLGPYFVYISSSFPDGSTVQSDVIKYEVAVDVAAFKASLATAYLTGYGPKNGDGSFDDFRLEVKRDKPALFISQMRIDTWDTEITLKQMRAVVDVLEKHGYFDLPEGEAIGREHYRFILSTRSGYVMRWCNVRTYNEIVRDLEKAVPGGFVRRLRQPSNDADYNNGSP